MSDLASAEHLDAGEVAAVLGYESIEDWPRAQYGMAAAEGMAWGAGHTAALDGEGLGACPWPPRHLAAFHWQQGWTEATTRLREQDGTINLTAHELALTTLEEREQHHRAVGWPGAVEHRDPAAEILGYDLEPEHIIEDWPFEQDNPWGLPRITAQRGGISFIPPNTGNPGFPYTTFTDDDVDDYAKQLTAFLTQAPTIIASVGQALADFAAVAAQAVQSVIDGLKAVDDARTAVAASLPPPAHHHLARERSLLDERRRAQRRTNRLGPRPGRR